MKIEVRIVAADGTFVPHLIQRPPEPGTLTKPLPSRQAPLQGFQRIADIQRDIATKPASLNYCISFLHRLNKLLTQPTCLRTLLLVCVVLQQLCLADVSAVVCTEEDHRKRVRFVFAFIFLFLPFEIDLHQQVVNKRSLSNFVMKYLSGPMRPTIHLCPYHLGIFNKAMTTEINPASISRCIILFIKFGVGDIVLLV